MLNVLIVHDCSMHVQCSDCDTISMGGASMGRYANQRKRQSAKRVLKPDTQCIRGVEPMDNVTRASRDPETVSNTCSTTLGVWCAWQAPSPPVIGVGTDGATLCLVKQSTQRRQVGHQHRKLVVMMPSTPTSASDLTTKLSLLYGHAVGAEPWTDHHAYGINRRGCVAGRQPLGCVVT